jgi:hypothetical protein
MQLAKPLDVTARASTKSSLRRRATLRSRFAAEHQALEAYPHCLYWSFHTTAGFLDRSLAARLSARHIPTYVDAFRTLFPEGAGYEHDRLDQRTDLNAEQRAIEPRNADSHLAYIASGLRTCVTHPNRGRRDRVLRGSRRRLRGTSAAAADSRDRIQPRTESAGDAH